MAMGHTQYGDSLYAYQHIMVAGMAILCKATYGLWLLAIFLRCNAICTCSCWCYGCKLCRYAIAQQPMGIADITLCYCSHIILYSDEGCKSKDIKGV